MTDEDNSAVALSVVVPVPSSAQCFAETELHIARAAVRGHPRPAHFDGPYGGLGVQALQSSGLLTLHALNRLSAAMWTIRSLLQEMEPTEFFSFPAMDTSDANDKRHVKVGPDDAALRHVE